VIASKLSGKSRGFGFVTFSYTNARKVLSSQFILEGRFLKIEVRNGYPYPGDDESEDDESEKEDSEDEEEEYEEEVDVEKWGDYDDGNSDDSDNDGIRVDSYESEDTSDETYISSTSHIRAISSLKEELEVVKKNGNRKLSSLEEQKRQLQQKVSRKKEKLKSAKTQITNLRSEVHTLESEISNLTKNIKTITLKLADMTTSYNEEKKYKSYLTGENLDQLDDSDLKKIYRNLKLEKMRRRTMKKCTVCLQKEVSIICLPCGHVCLCEECSLNVSNRCPLDRAKITELKRVYL